MNHENKGFLKFLRIYVVFGVFLGKYGVLKHIFESIFLGPGYVVHLGNLSKRVRIN
jgi:hypothetical protein